MSGTGEALEDPGEKLEIAPEIAEWIRSFHDRLEQMDLFELLGVDHDADPAVLRKAYLLRSKQFHPDRYFGKQLGPYKAMLERIFGWLAAGFKLLRDDDQRSAYRLTLQRRRRVSQDGQRATAGVIVMSGSAGLEFVIDDGEPITAELQAPGPKDDEEPSLDFFIDD